MTSGEKRPAEDDYEDDDFVVKPKRIHLQPVNGQIGPCAGHEYDEEEVSDVSEEEVLVDPADLFDSATESEPETENDYPLTDELRKDCFFVDHEAQESNGESDGDLETVEEESDNDVEQESDEDSDPDRDKSIQSPLLRADYVDDEAEEHNNISDMYDAIVGKEQMSDLDSELSEEESDVRNETTSIQTDDDDDEEIYFRKHRRNVFLSDDDSSESCDQPLATGSQTDVTSGLPVPSPNSGSRRDQESATNGYGSGTDDSDEDYSPADPYTMPWTSQNRKRYLKLRQLVKPWTVTSL